jgi:hypothetical protein
MAITQEDYISAHRAEMKKEDTNRAYNFATIKVSVGPKHCSSSPASK